MTLFFFYLKDSLCLKIEKTQIIIENIELMKINLKEISYE